MFETLFQGAEIIMNLVICTVFTEAKFQDHLIGNVENYDNP